MFGFREVAGILRGVGVVGAIIDQLVAIANILKIDGTR